MIAALHAGLGAVLDEGIDAARARHVECGLLLQDGLEELGLVLFAEESHRLPQLTTVEIPAAPARRDRARRAAVCCSSSRYGIEIGAGAGQLRRKGMADRLYGTHRTSA